MKKPADLCFMDTETLGLDPDAPVWEFAAIRRTYVEGVPHEQEFHCFIDHRADPWLNQMHANGGSSFVKDYLLRFDAPRAMTSHRACELINKATRDAHIVGAVPSFDTERLTTLLHSRGFEPAWHYHLIDVENVVVGHLAAKGLVCTPPWKSDSLSRAVGVEPEDFNRHTAMGDCQWVRAQWNSVMEGKSVE